MANGTISAGKNIQFLLGTQANLEKYISGSSTAAEGTFYLTNDTHRLYIVTSAGTAVPVNEGVITVSNIDALQHVSAHPGEFYYDSNFFSCSFFFFSICTALILLFNFSSKVCLIFT